MRYEGFVFSQQLIIVSGKGGVGKSALAGAIAYLLANAGPTILVTLETHHERHPFFDVPLTYRPSRVSDGLAVCYVEGLEAIREYVRRKMPFAGIYDVFLKSRMFRDFAGAAPGFEELMCLGNIYDLVTDSTYQHVVFDSPSTGHMKTLLDVPKAMLDAVRVGPLNHNALKIQDLLLDPERCQMVLAALPEEMAIREALELHEFCGDRRMNLGPIVVNQCVAERIQPQELDALDSLADLSSELRTAREAVRAEFELARSQSQAMQLLSGAPAARVLNMPRFIDLSPLELIIEMAGVLEVSGG